MSTLYLGIDPDLRCLNTAVLDGRTPLAVFVRRNQDGKGDIAVAAAAKGVAGILDDFIKFITANEHLQSYEIALIIESQNMQQAVKYRSKGHKVDYQDILHTGHISGIWAGVFAEVATRIILVQPAVWKGQVPKEIHHQRIYNRLTWPSTDTIICKNPLCPVSFALDNLVKYSHIKPNPGDFLDINDSIGLALFGAEKGL